MIAASFSQTYLRNAYNNGFLCIEVPELVKELREQFTKEVASKEKTIIPGGEIDIDFTSGVIAWAGEMFTFPAAGERTAVAGDRAGSGESGGEAAGAGVEAETLKTMREHGQRAKAKTKPNAKSNFKSKCIGPSLRSG